MSVQKAATHIARKAMDLDLVAGLVQVNVAITQRTKLYILYFIYKIGC